MISFSDLSNLTQQKSFKRSTSAREITIFLFITRAREADVSFSKGSSVIQALFAYFWPNSLIVLKEIAQKAQKIEHFVHISPILAVYAAVFTAFWANLPVFP
jgi:hypothetical protein